MGSNASAMPSPREQRERGEGGPKGRVRGGSESQRCEFMRDPSPRPSPRSRCSRGEGGEWTRSRSGAERKSRTENKHGKVEVRWEGGMARVTGSGVTRLAFQGRMLHVLGIE